MPLRGSVKFCVLSAARGALLATCGVGLASLLTVPASTPAKAQGIFGYPFPGQYYQPRYQPRYRSRQTYRRRAVRSAPKVPATPPAWYTAEKDNKDPLQIVVSLPEQKITVYKGDKVLTTSKVSSGKPGHTTPAGVFSILERKPRHFSNIYGGAPMPYMQRLTWSGIALHASNSVPNRPASHGCIRLPNSFAPQLFQVTTKGAHVVVANEEGIEPKNISHPNLFQPTPMTQEEFYEAEANRIAKLAGIEHNGATRSTKPVRILVTRRTGRELFMEMQSMLNELQFGAGDVDGWMGPDTSKAIRRFEKTYGLEPSGTMSQALIEKLYEVLGKGKPLNGHLYVRQNFKPVFDIPVLIKDGDKPLGSHVFTAMHFEPDDGETRWLGITLTKGSGGNKTYGRQARHKKKDLDEVVLTERPPEPSSAEEALSRMQLPDEVRTRISKMLTPGSSLAITNDGISRETTPKGTDFIVLMQ